MLSTALPAADLLDASGLLHSFGPWALVGIAVIIFVESGVLFPFLPGDSLLVSAAILGPALDLSPWAVVVVGTVAAIVGDQVGYVIGGRFGRRLFKDDARVLRTSYLDDAERFFARYGPGAIVLARFVAVARTFVPLAAGAARIGTRRFLLWNMVGGVVWVGGMVAIGVLLGGIPFVATHIDVLTVLAVVVSVVPFAVGALVKVRRGRAEAVSAATTSGAPQAGPEAPVG